MFVSPQGAKRKSDIDMPKYVEVVTDLPVDRSFQYKLPDSLQFEPAVGKRVWVPFRNRKKLGYIVELTEEAKVSSPRALIEIIDERPVISENLLELASWIKRNYFCSWGEAISAMLPGPLRRGKHTMATRAEVDEEKVESTLPHEFTAEQRVIFEKVRRSMQSKIHKVFLVHGITGSGKTEIYLQAMQTALDRGQSGVVLVPEISLTPQTVERFTSRFGEEVAVFHSAMLESVRFREWRRIASGVARVVVGPRSAVFSPLVRPGLFIVDEEHEPSYKQEDKPRYHAREVAIERARMCGCPVILGSATPSIESFYKAENSDYELTRLTKRIRQENLPSVKVVDMRMEFDTRTGRRVISGVLEEALRRELKKKNQALVFMNRRGFSTFVMCRKCGHVMKCSTCDSPMVFHRGKERLLCHYCNRRLSPPKICPECDSDYLRYRGTGTEKVEKELRGLLPAARIERMDSDTMKTRGSHKRLLKKFAAHQLDMLVGTQMIAKGFDFPKVTQIGVVSADANLNIPDFRSGERTFNLITQVAGRAGRGDSAGEVIVQTYAPDNYAIKLAARQDYEAFYRQELASRRELGFPPFSHVVKLTVRGRVEKDVEEVADRLSGRIKKELPDTPIMGPAPAPIAKIRGYYRWNILLTAPSRTEIVEGLRGALKSFRKKKGVKLAVDVDPMTM